MVLVLTPLQLSRNSFGRLIEPAFVFAPGCPNRFTTRCPQHQQASVPPARHSVIAAINFVEAAGDMLQDGIGKC